MATEGSAVYCTLLLSDHYLPGAMVLAHSLRDNGTKARLVVLITPESLQPATIDELKTIYDEVIPVLPISNSTPANLWLMERPDLIATFTKIELWRQTQFQRIVYIDCDVVALRPPDELLALQVDFAAAPDVGWPDCFNSGVMVLRPNLQDYYALQALAERGISFDGADQGLLNMHFRNWHRLSFTYNCTPSANYQYIPAYKHFQSTISMIHFIGAQKPWNSPRQVFPVESPYNQLLARWWSVYDKHYRPVPVTTVSARQPSRPLTPASDSHVRYLQVTMATPESQLSQLSHWEHASEDSHAPPPVSQPVYHTDETRQVDASSEGPYHGTEAFDRSAAYSTEQVAQVKHVDHGQPPSQQHHREADAHVPVMFSAVPQYVRGEEHVSRYPQALSHQAQASHPPPQHSWQPAAAIPPTPPNPSDDRWQEQHPQSEPAVESREPAPKPSSLAPENRSFEAPRIEWDASREPPPLNSRPEGIALQTQTYTMSEDTQLFQPPAYPEAPKDMYYQVPTTKPEPQKLTQLFPWESRAPKPTRVFIEHEQSISPRQQSKGSSKEESGRSAGSLTSWTSEEPTDSWQTYSRMNAWDEVPEIQDYIQSIQQSRKGKTQVISGTTATGSSARPISGQDAGVRLTDFPSEVERPSLPVTPAPIRRPSVWNQEEEPTTELPAAEGVPRQEDWNPLARLEELRRLQSGLLENVDLHERDE